MTTATCADAAAEVAVTGAPDFPQSGRIGLAVGSYPDSDVSYAAALLWIDRSAPSAHLIEQVSLSNLSSVIANCRVANLRAACVTADQLILVERGAQPGGAKVVKISLDAETASVLAFDGSTIYLSQANALTTVSFEAAAAMQATDGGLHSMPQVSFSDYPLTIAEMPGALVVASQYEVVTLAPACVDR